jgi:hypothetical protein
MQSFKEPDAIERRACNRDRLTSGEPPQPDQ